MMFSRKKFRATMDARNPPPPRGANTRTAKSRHQRCHLECLENRSRRLHILCSFSRWEVCEAPNWRMEGRPSSWALQVLQDIQKINSSPPAVAVKREDGEGLSPSDTYSHDGSAIGYTTGVDAGTFVHPSSALYLPRSSLSGEPLSCFCTPSLILFRHICECFQATPFFDCHDCRSEKNTVSRVPHYTKSEW
jgi:hypothetical protein